MGILVSGAPVSPLEPWAGSCGWGCDLRQQQVEAHLLCHPFPFLMKSLGSQTSTLSLDAEEMSFLLSRALQ